MIQDRLDNAEDAIIATMQTILTEQNKGKIQMITEIPVTIRN